LDTLDFGIDSEFRIQKSDLLDGPFGLDLLDWTFWTGPFGLYLSEMDGSLELLELLELWNFGTIDLLNF
jgi:hypothetical protein